MREFFSKTFFSKTIVFSGLLVAGLASVAHAQTAPADTVVANPTYISIPMEMAINRPAAEVWKRVGKYCDIGEWFQIPCTMTSGKEGDFGSVRSVGGEVLVGKTELSYTYTQTVKAGRPYNLYHGTLEARPVTATTSKLVYTLTYDNSMLADDAAREKDRAQKTTMFTRALNNMKILAEGGRCRPRRLAPPSKLQGLVPSGILVHGDNHFIVSGPLPDRDTAQLLIKNWTIIQIGATTPGSLQQWRIISREFRENLQWAVVVPGEAQISPAVMTLLNELAARGITIHQ